MKLKKVISAVRQKYLSGDDGLENSQLCGVPLQTLKGTVRKKIDQDDAWFFHLSKHNKVIFDIGSNIGFSALLAMIQDPNRAYILVDPNPLALSQAAKNLFVNSFGSRASFYSAFVGKNNKEKIKFYTVGNGAAGSMFKSHAETAAILDTFFWVETITLDSLVEHYNIKPDLVKIDVEGAESLVLEGAKKLAGEAGSKFIVEMHALKELSMEENTKKVLNWCEEVNYDAWYLKDGKIITDPAHLSDRGRCHILLLPKGSSYPKYLENVKQSAELPSSL